ncbi:MAG TPA: DUF4838 domain-containing protein [Chthoniobacteraceae bacterium]|nr:DUF4838 domain-containing protein [Chthoniobacteraceae bacterium]
MSATGAPSEGKKSGKVTLIEEGTSGYAIVLPEPTADLKANTALSRAAELLQSTLKKATGAELAIRTEDQHTGGDAAIYLGKGAAARAAGLPIDDLTGWSVLKAVRGNDLFLVGNDGPSPVDNEKMTYQGTTRAVASFLKDLGVVYLIPGQENGTFVPSLTRVTVPADLNVSEGPVMGYITGRAVRDPIYAAANGYLDSDIYKSFGGHSYYSAVPEKEFSRSHPEYFILKNGERSAVGNHLCISNPEVRELMLQLMEKEADKGYRWIELAQTDGYVPCECESCRAIHADPGERIWIVHRDLAGEMLKRRPEVKVMIIAYGPTAEPPASFREFPKNVIIQMSRYSADDFEKWKIYGDLPKTVYIYNWGTYLPTGFGPARTPRYVAEQARLFRANQVQGIYLCGGFQNPGLEGPVAHTYAKVLENPEYKEEDLLREFCEAAYGRADKPMLRFFRTLYQQLEIFCAANRPNHPDGSDATASTRINKPEELYPMLYPVEVLHQLARDLKEAGQLEDAPAIRARLRLVGREFDYIRTLADIFHLYHDYQAQPDWERFGDLQKAVEARTALIESWHDETNQPKIIDGFPLRPGSGANNSKAVMLAGGVNRAILHAPADWNFNGLREARFLPGVTPLKVRKITARKMRPLVLDGRIDDPAWKNAQSGELQEPHLRNLQDHTRFRVGYDEQYLYFAFECERSQMEAFDPTSAGKDGKTYSISAQDELEIVIHVGKARHYRFFFNPAENSRLDGRNGFITDELHPRYGKWEDEWDGKWDDAFHIDRKNDRWTAEVRIPFETISISPAQPGETLEINLRRVNFLYSPDRLGWAPGGSNSPVVSTWTGEGYKGYGVVTFE